MDPNQIKLEEYGDEWLKNSFLDGDESDDKKDLMVKVEEEGSENQNASKISAPKPEVLLVAILNHLSQLVKLGDKSSAKEAFDLAKWQFRFWVGEDLPFEGLSANNFKRHIARRTEKKILALTGDNNAEMDETCKENGGGDVSNHVRKNEQDLKLDYSSEETDVKPADIKDLAEVQPPYYSTVDDYDSYSGSDDDDDILTQVRNVEALSVATQTEMEEEKHSQFKVGDYVKIGEMVAILEGSDDSNLEYKEALLVREGYLMPLGWVGEFPPPEKRRAKGYLNDIPVIREVDYRPTAPVNYVSKAEVPKWSKQKGNLSRKRASSDKVAAAMTKNHKGWLTTKELYQRVVGADLVPIMVSGCYSGLPKESGSYLWAELCIWPKDKW